MYNNRVIGLVKKLYRNSTPRIVTLNNLKIYYKRREMSKVNTLNIFLTIPDEYIIA